MFQASQEVVTARVVYDGPVVTRVETPAGRPIEGRFPVVVQGENFFTSGMNVTIGGQPCADVTLVDTTTLDAFTCEAPPGPGFGAVQLRVAVPPAGTASFAFLYTAPSVTSVEPSPCLADALCQVTIRGHNLGSTSPLYSPPPVVFVGGQVCAQPIVADSTHLVCTAPVAVAGRARVVVSLNGQNSTTDASLDRLCGNGKFALPGQRCAACPKVRFAPSERTTGLPR
jgi:hypothetical protein